MVLRHEFPDQHVLDHRIIASYELIASLVTMSCRLLLRRAASRGVLPRERFRPLVKSGRRLVAFLRFAGACFDVITLPVAVHKGRCVVPRERGCAHGRTRDRGQGAPAR